MVKDETGSDLLSSQRIQAIVVEEARRLSMAPASRARAILGQGTPCPAINQQVDLYDEQSEEILLFNDGIQVKKQNATREKLSERLPQEDGKAPKERVNTDVMRVQRAHGGFTYMMEGLDSDGTDGIPVRAEELVKSEVIREYGERTTSLNLVAITDGARTIRLFFERVFGVVIMLILDWYHLEKKVWDLMSMIAWNTKEKERHCREILSCLGQGHVDDALGYLRRAVSPRNTRKYHELITYLTKHNAEIINYEKRRDAGKPVGSGRMEKGVDRVIGHRQKDNGMSWSVVGSKALGILNVHELNEQIEEPGLLLAA